MKKLFYKMYLLLIFIASCSENIAEKRLEEFESFVVTVQNQKDHFDEKAWDDADLKYERFTSDEYLKPILEGPPELKTKYENLKGKYLAYRYLTIPTKSFGKMLRNLDSIKTSLKNTLEGLKEGIKDIKIE